ncbi:MAG: hypothetical protein ACE5Q6_20325, partial [Dehalococcoidia bacterium]
TNSEITTREKIMEISKELAGWRKKAEQIADDAADAKQIELAMAGETHMMEGVLGAAARMALKAAFDSGKLDRDMAELDYVTRLVEEVAEKYALEHGELPH